MPTAIFFARVSAANAFCSVICDPEYEASTSSLKPDIVQAFQLKFQSFIAAFQESSDPAKSSNRFDLQHFVSEFDSLCTELNVPIAALRLVCSIYAHQIFSNRYLSQKRCRMHFKKPCLRCHQQLMTTSGSMIIIYF